MKKKSVIKKVAIRYALYETIVWTGICMYLKKHKVTEVDGIDVYRVPKFITNDVMHIYIAGATQLIYKPIIIVDDDFDAICKHNPNVGKFVLAHEVGHIKLGHIKANMKTLLSGRKPKRNVQFEIEADTYACTTTSVHIGVEFIDEFESIIEPERIENIEKLYIGRKVW